MFFNTNALLWTCQTYMHTHLSCRPAVLLEERPQGQERAGQGGEVRQARGEKVDVVVDAALGQGQGRQAV